MRRIITIIVFILLGFHARAWHIIGGEMIYTRLAGNTFEVTLKIYRDCSNPDAAAYDDPLQIYVYTAEGALVDSLVLFFPGSDLIDPSIINPCVEVNPDLCIEEGIYVGTIDLPAHPGGYNLVYQRCCRNSTILNISEPVNTGVTYSAHIPDPGSIINSSPRFTDLPPVAICAGYPFSFNHMATDPDGDDLVYRFFTPYTGASFDFPDPSPALPPPFSEVIFIPPYAEDYPVASSPAFAIDPVTGWLAGIPTDLGQFVVGIACEEWRDGVLLDVHYRDFQFNVTDCTPSIVAAAPAYISECDNYTVLFDNYSFGTDEFYWDFGVPGITTDTSTDDIPSYTYPAAGTYTATLIAFPGYECSDTTYITVYVYPELIADIAFDFTCAGDVVEFTDLSTTDFGTITDWEWNYGDGWGSVEQNPEYVYEESGSYMLIFTVTNNYGCTAQLYDTIRIYPLPHAIIESDTLCINQIDTIESGSIVILPFTITDWEWTLYTGEVFNTESVPYAFPDAGTYPVSLTVTSSVGCVDSTSADIYVAPPVTATPIYGDTVCAGEELHLITSGGTLYDWSPPEFASTPNSQSTYYYPEYSTWIYVVVSDGCTADTASAYFEVLPAPDIIAGPDTTVYHFEEVELYAFGAESFVWTPTEGLSDPSISNPVALPDQTTAYIVTGTGPNGCKSTDTALIQILPVCFKFATANAFSPNGDGINDKFRLVTAADDELVSMEIFNRWGAKVFSTNSLENGWDGTDGNGVPQEVGMYVYIMYTTCEGVTQRLDGTVTLLR